MPEDFDEVLPRRNSESFKWRTYPPDVLPLFVADMDFKSPARVAQALRRYIDEGVFGYPRGLHSFDASELPSLSDIVVERMDRRYGWRITPEDVVYIPGVVPGLNLACHAVSSEGGAVLVQPPVYPPILSAPVNAHQNRQEAELERAADGSYSINWDTFESAITPETRMFILCNPHNPVGKMFGPEDLARIAETCLSKDVVICSDEIHSDLVFGGRRHTPIASIDYEIAQRTITFVGPSKTFNLAGLQCAFAIIPNADLRRRFQAAREGLTPWINAPGIIAAQAAYRECQPWLDELLLYLERNRDFLHHFVRTELPGIRMTIPEATHLAWLDCRDLRLTNPYEFFLNHARVALSDGSTFGPGGAGFLRLNFACPRRTLEDALERIRRACFATGPPAPLGTS